MTAFETSRCSFRNKNTSHLEKKPFKTTKQNRPADRWYFFCIPSWISPFCPGFFATLPLGQWLGPRRHPTAAEKHRGSPALCGTTAVERWQHGYGATVQRLAEYGPCKNGGLVTTCHNRRWVHIICICNCDYLHMYLCIRIFYSYMYIYIYMHMCIYNCIYVNIYIYVCIPYVYANSIYIYILVIVMMTYFLYFYGVSILKCDYHH